MRCRVGKKAWVLRTGDAICDGCHDERVVLATLIFPAMKGWLYAE